MKRLLTLVAFFATIHTSAQQVNPVPDYVFRNQMSVGRGTVTDTAAYFSIGPRYGATKGFMPPIVVDTASFSGSKRNGLLIFSVQKNKFLYWDSVRVQWSDMAGSSGSYITGTGITGYLPQFNGTTTLDTSALFTLGNRLGIGTSTFAYNSTNTANIELNGTAGGILGFKRNDSARGYLWHTGDNMELANTVAGSISFNTNSATRGSISSAGVWRLHNLAGTGDRVVVASSNGTLSASASVTGLVDTTTISTRAWRQKGDDSLGAIIATKGSGTVTSVATGYGLSGGTITTTGTLLVDTLNIATRAWRQKGLDSLAALEVSGSGTTNYVPKFTAGSTIGNSQIFDNGTNVGIGTASPVMKFETRDGDIGVSTLNTFSHFLANRNTIPSGAGTSLTGIKFRAYSTGTTYVDGAQILAFSDGAWSSTSAPTYLSFQTTAASSTSPTERLRITSGGDVGIGTSSPTGTANRFVNIYGSASNELHLTNATTGTTSTDGFTILQSGNDIYQYNYEAGFLEFGTSNASRLRIFANGRVGINTTTDAGYQLDVNGTARINNALQVNKSDGGQAINIVGNSNTASIQQNGSDMYFNSNTNTTGGGFFFRNSSSFTTRMAIDASGNVGIGTASPANKLSINGAANALTYFLVDNSQTYLGDNGVIGGGAADGNTALSWFSTKDLYFKEGSSTRMTMKSGGELLINTTTDAGDYKLQVAGNIYGSGLAVIGNAIINTNSPFVTGANIYTNGQSLALGTQGANLMSFFTNNAERGRINSAGEWIIDASGTDAGDYKLQVVGNARVGTGKLDIVTNTAFGLSVSRSGTSVVAGQINNSNGILYYGSESSTGGGLFTGSSAYAAVIGSGAAYPLQFATDNVTRATINTNGELLIATTTDNGDFKLQVNGSALISGSIQTANPVSGTAVPWRLGSVIATNVQLDTANYVEVNINGTFYRLAIVTPL